MTPDQMMDELLNSAVQDHGQLVNDLLTEFFRGYPIGNLNRLIYSDLQSARGVASFIAEELHYLAAPVLRDIATLLDHSSARARYDALSVLWKCATYKDGWAIARVLECLNDPWPGVRMGAMDAVRLGERYALLAGFKEVRTRNPETVFAKFGKAFLKAERGDDQVIEALLADENPVARRFAAGLAARPRLTVNENRVRLASTSSDAEISNYADEAITRILPPWASRSGA